MESLLAYIRRMLQPQYTLSEIKALSSIICCDLLHISAVELYTGKDTDLSSEKQQILEDILIRLSDHEPIQYICGKTDFCDYSFIVTPDVLIPRPETAEMVRLIANENKGASRILDIGTGSGCIAISLDKLIKDAKVTGWDISPDALVIARKNNLRLQADVDFEQRDIFSFEQDDDSDKYDIIVSNPPYVTESDKKDMQPEVLNYEPKLALFVPDEDPLLFYRRIISVAPSLLTSSGKVYFEINQRFGKAVCDLLQQANFRNVRLYQDFLNNDRIVTATR